MENLQRPLLFLLVFLLIIAGWLSQLGLTIDNTFLSRSYYDDLFKKIDLSVYARAMMQEELMKELPVDLPDFAMEAVSDVLGSIYDDAWIKGELIVIIDDLILFVKEDKREPKFHLNLTEKNEEMRALLRDSVDRGPKNILNIFGFDTSFLDDFSSKYIDEVEMPDYFDLNDYFMERGVTDDIMASVKKIKEFRSFYLVFPYAAIVFLFILIVILEGIFNAFKWTGTAFLISGVTFFLLTRIVRPLYVNALSESMAQDGMVEFAAVITALDLALNKAIVYPLFYIFIGLIFIAINYYAVNYLHKNSW